MKKNFYLQHSLMAMNDPRMKTLIEEEGLKGLGAYWFILERLELLPQPYAQLEYLQPFCKKNIALTYVGKIIGNYQLFIIDEDGFFSPAELNPEPIKAPKSTRNKQKNVENEQEIAQNNEITKQNTAKFNENLRLFAQKHLKKSVKNTAKISVNKQENSDLSKSTEHNTKENIKDIIITTAEKEKERTDDDDNSFKNLIPAPLQPKRPTPPSKHWHKLVDDLPQDSYWLEIACMKSGYSSLLLRHIKKASELFKQHIELYDKSEGLVNMSDVRAYFVNFVKAGSRTSMALRDALSQWDAIVNAPTIATNPHRYEQLIDGRRTYLGCPIPDYAPPRPNENALWNDQTRTWTSLQSTPKRCGNTPSAQSDN